MRPSSKPFELGTAMELFMSNFSRPRSIIGLHKGEGGGARADAGDRGVQCARRRRADGMRRAVPRVAERARARRAAAARRDQVA